MPFEKTFIHHDNIPDNDALEITSSASSASSSTMHHYVHIQCAFVRMKTAQCTIEHLIKYSPRPPQTITVTNRLHCSTTDNGFVHDQQKKKTAVVLFLLPLNAFLWPLNSCEWHSMHHLFPRAMQEDLHAERASIIRSSPLSASSRDPTAPCHISFRRATGQSASRMHCNVSNGLLAKQNQNRK